MAEVGGVVAVSRISVVSEDEGDVDDVDMLVQRNEEMRQELERDEMEQQQHQQYDTSPTSKHNEMEIETDHVWEAPETASMSLSDDEDKVRGVTSEASDATSQQPSSPAPVWFCRRSEDCKGPQQQMFDRADELGHTVYVASDGQGGNGSKVYTSFMDHAELTVMLISNYNNQQPSSYYEITREGKPCKLHLDTEWESSMGQREAHIRLSNVVSKLEKKLKEETGISPEIIVLDGSRAKKGDVVKHSFHIIASNVVFTSNCGRMKSFTEGFVAENSDDPLFFCGVDCKGKPKCIIDLGIYTKNRCFRTEYSHKKDDATHTKLQRIVPIESKDEYGNGFIVWEKRPATSSSIELLDSFVTCIPDGLAVIPDHVQPVRSQSSRASGSGAGAAIARVSRAGDVSVSSSAGVAAMQKFVIERGIEGIEVIGAQSYNSGRTIYKCKNVGERPCLVNRAEIHTSNNMYLQVEVDGTVLYKCHAASCKDSKPFKIPGCFVDDAKGESSDGMETDEEEDCGSDVMKTDEEEGGSSERSVTSASTGKRHGCSVWDDDSNKCKQQKLSDSRETEATQTLVSIESRKGRPVDLADVERVLTTQPQLDGKVLTARLGCFPEEMTPGDTTGTEVQTELIETSHLKVPEDARPSTYRLNHYVMEIVAKYPGIFSDAKRCKTLSIITMDACKNRAHAKELLKSLCATKSDKKHLKRCFNELQLKNSIVEDGYALALLQRWYVGSDKTISRQEYGLYELVKADVEKTLTKLTKPYCFVHLDEEQRVIGEERSTFNLVAPNAVRGTLENKYHYVWELNKEDGEYAVKQLPFVSKWMKDEDIKTRSFLTFDPSNSIEDKDGMPFNTWLGFATERLRPVSDDVAIAALARFHKHILDVVGCTKVCDFIEDYFAHILQRPSQKTGVCMLLQGSQGCGKGTIFDFIRQLIGHYTSFQCSGPKAREQLFGKFSIGLKNTLFVQIDEAKDMYELDDMVKDVVTIDRKQFEDKGVQPYTLKVRCNIVLTSNADHPIPIPDKERRWMAVKCNETHTGDCAYFTDLHDFLKKPETQRGIYQAFKSSDISHRINMQMERPITPYYLECRNISMCPLARFLSALCNSSVNDVEDQVVQSYTLFKNFETFAAALGGDVLKKWNITLFGLRMKQYADTDRSGISMPGSSGKSDGVKKFIFDFSSLRNHLNSEKKFDENAELEHNFLPPY